jgi:hypothetical protein
MPYPVKTCALCGEKFELKPDKPGFANRCPDCTDAEADNKAQPEQSKATREQNAARREAMRNLLYRKDS